MSAVFAGNAFAHAPKSIVIRHQLQGCHAWSFAGGPYKTSLSLKIDGDTALVFVDNDMMAHRLIQLSGPKARLSTPNMNTMGAKAVAVFPKPGVYKFTTKAGKDYMKGMKTIGPNNLLRLSVTVS
jgi:hypothetical protein